MGKKGKAKTKAKKVAKKAAAKKGKKLPIKKASKLAKAADKGGFDVAEFASAAVGGIPFVGGIASNLIDQGVGLAGGQGKGGRGGTRGVQLVDSTLGNLGTISRKKALSILVNRGRRPPRRRTKTIAILRAGESAQVVN